MVDSAADHHHRPRALDEGSLYVAHHRHLLGRHALRGRQLSAGNAHDVSGHGGQGWEQRQHPGLSRHPWHPRCRHHALGCDECLRRVGDAHDQGEAQRLPRHRAARHRHLHRRLLQLPHRRHRHASRHGQVSDRAHKARLHHRRDGGTDLYHRPRFQLGGGSRLVPAGGRAHRWLYALLADNSIQPLRMAHDSLYALHHLDGTRLRRHAKER